MSYFVELPKEKLNITTKNINQPKLDLDIDDFYNNDVILISSGTATGKTRNIAKLSKDLKSKYNTNILSIVNLITLSREQRQAFKEESDIDLKDYQKDINDFGNCDGVICINSLYKLMDLDSFDMSNTILYIDEVNDLIRTLTHNDSLDKVLNLVYTYLIKLIKNCKKIIFSDATIDKNTLNLLSSRKENNKTILIKNSNKKFTGTDAIRHNDENKFLDQVRYHIKNKKYFLFGCDNCKRITTIFTKLIGEFENQKDDFILITGDTTFRPNNASEQFKDKYVFYSPSITTGVSFVLKDVKQTQFIYISEKPLITPISIYQMSSRTRNMNKLYYYCREIKPKKMEYDTLKEVENKYKKFIKLNEKVLSMSKSINENDEIKIIENSYFKMFCYNEYQDLIFKTGFLNHYENILKDNGFNISEKGQNNKLEKEEQKEFNEVYKMIKDDEFNEFVELKFMNIENEEDVEKQTDLKIKFSNLDSRCSLLNIPTKEEAEIFKIFLIDEYALRHYFDLLNLFRKEEYIKLKFKEKEKETFKIKTLTNIYTKVSLLKQFEIHYKINRFNLNFDNVDATVEISDKFQSLYKQLFPRLVIKSYSDKYELLKIYVNIIKGICGDIPIIISKRVKKNKKCSYQYSLNLECLIELMTLLKFNNPIFNNFDIELIEKITKIKPELTSQHNIKDEDDLVNLYLFNKKNFKK